MAELGKMLIVFGVILLVLGLLLIGAGRIHLPLGKLPGDIYYRGRNTSFYFPLATSILVSLALYAILYFISRFKR